VRFPIGIRSTLPSNTTAYDSAEADQRVRVLLSIYKADAQVKQLADRGFQDVESAKNDVTEKAFEVLRHDNILNVVTTDVLQSR
jgi:hypothetical protein